MAENDDPRARWRRLPERVHPEDSVEEVEVSEPDSSLAADQQAARRDLMWLLERGGGLSG